MFKLLSLICELQKGKFKNADVCIFTKPDVKRIEKKFWRLLEPKFDRVWHVQCRRSAMGWPAGPNALAMDVFKHLYCNKFEYEAAMLIESDCIPLDVNWIDKIMEEWRSHDKLVMGYWDGGVHDGNSHLNGNLVFHSSIIDHVKGLAFDHIPTGGWDVVYWQQLRPHSYPSRLIFSDYRLNTPRNPLKSCEFLWEPKFHRHPENPLRNEPLQPVWLHGVKGDAGYECVRKRFFLTS